MISQNRQIVRARMAAGVSFLIFQINALRKGRGNTYELSIEFNDRCLKNKSKNLNM